MAQSVVDVIVRTRGQSDLDKLGKSFEQTERASDRLAGRLRDTQGRFVGTGRAARTAAGDIDKAGRAADGATSRMSGLVGVLGKLAAAYGAVRLAQNAFNVGVSRIESERRISALASAFGEVEAAQSAATRAAQKFGISQTEANQGFAQIYARLRPIGIQLADIETAYAGFNTAAKLSGASAGEASSAWLQLSQALGSGVLRGEELNSVFEQTPTIVQAIANEMGVTIGEIRKLAQEGKITSDVVMKALGRIEKEGAANLTTALGGPAQAMQEFRNVSEEVQISLTRAVIPEITRALRELNGVILGLEEPIKFIGSLLATTLGSANDLISLVSKPRAFTARQQIQAGRAPDQWGAEELFGKGGVQDLIGKAREYSRLRRQPFNQVLIDLMQQRLGAMQPAAPTPPSAPTPRPTPAPPTTPAPRGGGASATGARAAGAAGPVLPATISKEQLRQWLYTQGFGRTTGDFTNAGHKTPNHILNAMDMGILGGSDANALRLTSDMERKLRATGAFGNQLFGPISDPYGHGAGKGGQNIHLHIPTPGGRVKMTPGLASLMGLSGAGAGGAMELQQGLMDQAMEQQRLQQQRAEQTAEQLKNSERIRKEAESGLAIEKETDAIKRLQLQAEQEIYQTKTKFADLLTRSMSAEETLNLQVAERNEIDKINLDTNERINEVLAERAKFYSELMQKAAEAPAFEIGKGPIQQRMEQLRTGLADTEGQIVQLSQSIESTLASSMSNAITGLIDGTKTVKEAMSDMFKGIGASFIQMATQMMSQRLVLGLLGGLGGMFGGGGLGGSPFGISPVGGGLFGGGSLGLVSGFSFSGGGYTGDGPRSGGVDGEGGFPAILHPQETVIDHSNLRQGMSGGKGAGASPLTLNVTATRIGDTDFVKVADLQAAMRQTRREAAADGEKRALAKLQQSPSTRRRVGI